MPRDERWRREVDALFARGRFDQLNVIGIVRDALERQREQIAEFVSRVKIRVTLSAPDGSTSDRKIGCEEVAGAIRDRGDEA